MKPPLRLELLLLSIAALLAASTVTAASCDDRVCPAVVIPLPKECTLRTTHQIPADVCTCVWDTCSCGWSCRFPQCPHKNTTVTCLAEPCASQNCAYGCTNDYCNGCNGYCWEKPYTPTNPTTTGSPTGPTTPVTTKPPCDGICPAVVVPLPDGCQVRNINATSECLCEWDQCSCGWQCSMPAGTPCPNPVQCLVDPCSTTTCREGTTCQSNYCGACTATCVPNPPITTKPPCNNVCPAVVVPLPTGCQQRHATATSECLCDWDQCSCGWQCSIPSVTPCPNPVQCLVDPCSTTTCRDGTRCVSSYCGACTATCVPVEVGPNSPVTTKPPCNNVCAAMIEPLPTGCQIRHPNATSECLCDWDQCSCKYQCSIPSITPCPNPVQCLVDPCSTAKCRNGTRCQSNYCGACTATCIAIEEGPNPTDCPNPVQCLVDPCSTTNCSIGTTCKSNYCGGCTATCVPNASGPTRPTPDCPNPVQCLVNPCATMLCPSGTICEANYCNGCNATCKPIATEKPPMNCDGVKCVDPCIRMTCITGSTCVKTDCCTATCAPTTTPTNANDTSTKCLHHGQIYSNGQTIEDGCNTCICQNGSMICTARACASSTSGISNDTCIYNGQTYTHGQSVKSTDGCNTCTCTNNGGMACTLMACSSTGNNNNNVTCTAFGRTYTPGQSMLSLDGCNTCRCGQDGQIACTLMACLNNTATYVGVTPTVLFATSIALAMIV